MKRNLLLGLIVLSVSVWNDSAEALSISDIVSGTNITINDGRLLNGVGVGQEDNETEQGTILSQDWDAEAFFYNYSTGNLYLVAGFDFNNVLSGFHSGDIWLDTTNDSTLNYNQAISFWNDSETADDDIGSVIFSGNLVGSNPFYAQNVTSAPVDYVSGDLNGASLFTVNYFSNLTDGLGLTGMNGNNTHYALSMNIGQLSYFSAHWVMSCGNDNILGTYLNDDSTINENPVPEPMSLVLLGSGLVGIMAKKRKK